MMNKLFCILKITNGQVLTKLMIKIIKELYSLCTAIQITVADMLTSVKSLLNQAMISMEWTQEAMDSQKGAQHILKMQTNQLMI